MDVHIPSAVTEGLRRRGIDVLRSQDDGTSEFDDEALLKRANELGRVLFSQDDDLLRIANEWHEEGATFNGLVYAHQRGATIGQCVEDLFLIAECCSPAELRNQVFYLPL